MMQGKNILAISGSTRLHSSNLNLIRAIEKLYAGKISIKIYDGLLNLPQFNPDTDTDNPPAQVTDLRKQIREARGILICTPEYAMGIPGSLKNLLDWTVSSSDFSGKPVVAITASLSGQKAHLSLMDTLQVIEASISESTQLLISFIKTKVNDQQQITDENTLNNVKRTMDAFIAVLKN